MAPSRTVQTTTPSANPPIPPLIDPPPPHQPAITQLASSSSQPDDLQHLQMVEFQRSIDLLQDELHQSVDSINQNQFAFQNHIAAQIAALQSTLVHALTNRPQPLPSPPPPASLQFPLPPTPSTVPAITFGSIPSPHTPPHTAAPLHDSTIMSIPQSIPTPDVHTPFPTFNAAHRPLHHYYKEHQTLRPPKFNLPIFTGDDVIGWFTMAERYLRTQRIPPSEHIFTVASHFGPDACMWMNSFEQQFPTATWDKFASAFLEHHGAGNTMEFKIALSNLKQSASVNEFILTFTKLAGRTKGWSEAELLPIFLSGLKPEIQHDVIALDPQTLVSAQRLARRFELKLADIRSSR
ncbi:putative retrotransposon gag domain-containing protein [Rosa chinensis]|uniref:Putative retrotransposon gag domain-containing protein n=1 Tax=Rosa chinensis TaxID=74649 RepID=A0A2P6SDA9_ROSCH|nr:putative retrotransposon gag domain-containing protein [Rosa chinensis]